MAALLRIEDLCHVYGKDTPFETTAIDHVSFEADRGEIIGLIGHTGSGKSTFVQHLNGLLKPSSGRVFLDGQDIWANKQSIRQARFRVGVVFQYPEHQLFEETVYKDISFGPKNMRLSEEEVDMRVRESAGFVGLTDEMLEKSPFELSGGEKRRVAIAGVIAMRPDILVLDEPTAGLDPQGRESILNNIQAYHDSMNSTIIFVTHSMEEIVKLASRLVVFNDARIVMDGKPAEIFRHEEELAAMGLSVPEVTKIMSRLQALGMPVDPSIFTVSQAVEAILALKRGGHHA